MTEFQTAPVPGQVSPDGLAVFNGQAWVPNPNLPPAKKSHTVRNVLLALLAVFVLCIGGCMALIGGAANEIDKAVKESEKADQIPGRADNPLTITPGKAFEVDGFAYAGGWSLGKDVLDSVDVTGLKVTNNRDSEDTAIVEIKVWQGTEVVASLDCTSDEVAVGTTVKVTCFSSDDMPASYDKVTINDTF